MSVSVISVSRLNELINSGESVELIDVRTPVEFHEVHVPIACNTPLDQLNTQELLSRRPRIDAPLYVICKSGSRGRQACERLIAAGGTNVINVEGGTAAWDAAGFPVRRGKKAMSLGRQVRIAAGLSS